VSMEDGSVGNGVAEWRAALVEDAASSFSTALSTLFSISDTAVIGNEARHQVRTV